MIARSVLVAIALIGVATPPAAASFVLHVQDLGPADEVNSESNGRVFGSRNGQAIIIENGATTVITQAGANATATAGAGDWIGGTAFLNNQFSSYRYNTQTGAFQVIGAPLGNFPTSFVDIDLNGNAVTTVDAGFQSVSGVWFSNGNNTNAPTANDAIAAGINESGQAAAFDKTTNSALIYSLSFTGGPTHTIADFNPSAGFEGSLLGGVFDTDGPVPAFYNLGSLNLSLVPQLDPSNVNGGITAFNALGQFAGEWDGETFFYDATTQQIVSLDTAPQIGAPFTSLGAPTAVGDNGFLYGLGQVEVSPGVFEDRAYRAELVPIPEPASFALGLLAIVPLGWRRRRRACLPATLAT